MRILKLLGIIILVISPFLLHVWRKNMVNTLNIRIASFRKEVNIQRNIVIRLCAEYREATCPPVIERRARKELNMRYPAKNEIIYLKSKHPLTRIKW